ncbi:hypothetical protein [Streptomyces millisiae]|uniref:Uncharacterized protein n=1 Tax=Streptomyces millisiae TaxID=3075542 RepID=A0ABU2LLR7_9ACTN|nr:hypothetical protein [Streptomyces sp. DSM 44918]MDT0318529.1 hypothetical protein [Streptomyces sp. DSM 44918]
MTTDDRWLVDAMWRATDLTRAYLAQNRSLIATCLTGLDAGRLERVLAWLVLDHDELFDTLGGPSMAVRQINGLAALAPLEHEFATTTAIRRVAAKESTLTQALEDLAPLDRIHTIAICTAVMLLEAYGSAHALKQLDDDAAHYEHLG